MSNAAVVQDEAEDRYYTQVEAGDVRLFTLDQLDAAFNAGLIHENTFVCLEGDSKWLTLGEVAGLGEEEEEAPVSAPQLVAAPVPQAAQNVFLQQAPVPAAFAPQSYAAPSAPIKSSVPYSVAPTVAPSLRPVVNDLALDDDDMEMMAMRRKRPLGKILAGVAVLALGGLGFAVVSGGGIRLPKLADGVSQASAASLSGASVKTPEAAKPAPVTTPAPEAAKPEPPKEEAKPAQTASDSETAEKKKSDDRFTEDMKAALLNKDKQQAATQKQKKAARGSVAAKFKGGGGAKAKSGGGFKAGGSAYDPLNGKL